MIDGVYTRRSLDAEFCQDPKNKGDVWTRLRLIVRPKTSQCQIRVGESKAFKSRLWFDCDMTEANYAGGPMVVNGFGNTVAFKGFALRDEGKKVKPKTFLFF